MTDHPKDETINASASQPSEPMEKHDHFSFADGCEVGTVINADGSISRWTEEEVEEVREHAKKFQQFFGSDEEPSSEDASEPSAQVPVDQEPVWVKDWRDRIADYDADWRSKGLKDRFADERAWLEYIDRLRASSQKSEETWTCSGCGGPAVEEVVYKNGYKSYWCKDCGGDDRISGDWSLHMCKVCGALWRLFSDSWSLLNAKQKPGKCCDNEFMGDQIEPAPPYLKSVPATEGASRPHPRGHFANPECARDERCWCNGPHPDAPSCWVPAVEGASQPEPDQGDTRPWSHAFTAESFVPSAASPELCESVYRCGPECCNTELWRCLLLKGHGRKHQNTMIWDDSQVAASPKTITLKIEELPPRKTRDIEAEDRDIRPCKYCGGIPKSRLHGYGLRPNEVETIHEFEAEDQDERTPLPGVVPEYIASLRERIASLSAEVEQLRAGWIAANGQSVEQLIAEIEQLKKARDALTAAQYMLVRKATETANARADRLAEGLTGAIVCSTSLRGSVERMTIEHVLDALDKAERIAREYLAEGSSEKVG